jgi:hypothetical protein
MTLTTLPAARTPTAPTNRNNMKTTMRPITEYIPCKGSMTRPTLPTKDPACYSIPKRNLWLALFMLLVLYYALHLALWVCLIIAFLVL